VRALAVDGYGAAARPFVWQPLRKQRDSLGRAL